MDFSGVGGVSDSGAEIGVSGAKGMSEGDLVCVSAIETVTESVVALLFSSEEALYWLASFWLNCLGTLETDMTTVLRLSV